MSEHSEIEDHLIGGKTVGEWDKLWREIPDALKITQTRLRHEVGLIRAKLNGRTMYIFRATEYGKGGIEKGLQRIRGKPQTGNASYGAQMLRQHAEDLTIEILPLGNDWRDAEAAKDLKSAMVRLHDPEWNKPHRNHMTRLRAGEGL